MTPRTWDTAPLGWLNLAELEATYAGLGGDPVSQSVKQLVAREINKKRARLSTEVYG